MDGIATSVVDTMGLSTADLGEKVLVVESRSQGRRMLQWLARQGVTLLNISVETPYTLAVTLCQSETTSSATMAPAVAEGLILSLLKEETQGFYGGETAQTPTVAKALYTTFLELAMAKVPPLQGAERLDATQKLRQGYEEKKKTQGRLDRSDVFRRAIELVADAKRWKNTAFFTLSTFAPTPLEGDFLTALTGGTIGVIPMPEGKAVDSLEKGRCRFVSCRGVETEVRGVFRDILTKGYPIEDCAVVYVGKEYAPLLYKMAPRWEIPVTMGGGISLEESLLFSTLGELEAFTKEQFPVERLYRLLTTGACTPKAPVKLAKVLAQRPMTWGRELYQLTQEHRPTSLTEDKDWADWLAFLACVIPMGNGNLPVETQKKQIQDFLAHYTPLHRPGESGAYRSTLDLLDSAAQVLEQGESLLSRLLSLMEGTSYLPNATTANTLLVLPLTQALLSGRKRLYIVGLTRYALEYGGTQSPILLDREREGLSQELATVSRRAQRLAQKFDQLILSHSGDFVFMRPDFESVHMIDVLPSPFYTEALERLQVAEEQVSYLPVSPLTAADFALATPEAQPTRTLPELGQGEVVTTDLADTIKGFRFSASSLEAALACPLQFYVERVLKLRDETPTPTKTSRWLHGSTRGTFVHQVLEDYYADPTNPQRPDLEDLYPKALTQLEEENPCLHRETQLAKERELPEIRRMVEEAIQWTTQQGRNVCATEQSAGTSEVPMTLKIGEREILFSGSIDRVDKQGDKVSILDYKTGNVIAFQEKHELHLQHYLYTQAYEQTNPDTHIDVAGYLLLDDGVAYEGIEQSKKLREEMEAKVLALLDILSDEEKIQTPRPCYVLQGKELVQGDKQTRLTAYRSCKNYCAYKQFCAQYWEGVSNT